MFRSRFFLKLFATYAALVVLTAVVIGALVFELQRRSSLERLEDSLRAQTTALWPWVERAADPSRRAEAQAFADDLARRNGVRITIVANDGVVWVDTSEDPAQMVNHLDRPEIQEALALGHGSARRFSRTLQRELFYVAHSRGGAGAVRVSIPTDEVTRLQLATVRRILAGAGVATVLALLLGAYIARRITAPLEEMTRAAEGILEGDFELRLEPAADELGILAGALNRLGVEVSRRIDAIRADEAQLRAMLAGMVEGVVAVDARDRIVFVNHAARRLLGLRDGTAPGLRLWESVRVPGLEQLLGEARTGDDAARLELAFHNEGRETLLRATAHRLHARELSGVVMVFDDVTELRRLERVRRDFVANVSHELKTPLTSIRGYVETLLDGALDDERNNRRFLEKARDNVERLGHLVADLLSLARIEEQEGGLTLESVDWSGLVEGAARRVDDVARGGGVQCELELPGGPVRVMADRESLRQVVDNLLDNAVKYTPDGGRVTLALSAGEAHATLEVRDTGIGIPPEDLERIFERFYRVDKARSRELGGTGLGLSIVKHLVKAMDGEISVESEVGRGSTFRVTLPRAG